MPGTESAINNFGLQKGQKSGGGIGAESPCSAEYSRAEDSVVQYVASINLNVGASVTWRTHMRRVLAEIAA